MKLQLKINSSPFQWPLWRRLAREKVCPGHNPCFLLLAHTHCCFVLGPCIAASWAGGFPWCVHTCLAAPLHQLSWHKMASQNTQHQLLTKPPMLEGRAEDMGMPTHNAPWLLTAIVWTGEAERRCSLPKQFCWGCYEAGPLVIKPSSAARPWEPSALSGCLGDGKGFGLETDAAASQLPETSMAETKDLSRHNPPTLLPTQLFWSAAFTSAPLQNAGGWLKTMVEK